MGQAGSHLLTIIFLAIVCRLQTFQDQGLPRGVYIQFFWSKEDEEGNYLHTLPAQALIGAKGGQEASVCWPEGCIAGSHCVCGCTYYAELCMGGSLLPSRLLHSIARLEGFAQQVP